MRVVHCGAASEIARFSESPGRQHFNPSDFETHHADIHLCVLSENSDVQARCSLWWNDVPAHGQYRVGIVGHYFAATADAAAAVLAGAQKQLREAGCTLAIGPMNGNTWRSYRFVTESGGEPAFFLEPENPPEWPLQFEKAGFSSLASYVSALNSDLSRPDPRADAVESKLAEAGVKIR